MLCVCVQLIKVCISRHSDRGVGEKRGGKEMGLKRRGGNKDGETQKERREESREVASGAGWKIVCVCVCVCVCVSVCVVGVFGREAKCKEIILTKP